MSPHRHRSFQTLWFDFGSFFFTGLTGLATGLILATLAVILGTVLVNGWPLLSWRFITGGTAEHMFDVDHAGIVIVGRITAAVRRALPLAGVGKCRLPAQQQAG